ncbi:MAG: RimK/LysX family protein [Gammaproteobacteria bacterium]
MNSKPMRLHFWRRLLLLPAIATLVAFAPGPATSSTIQPRVLGWVEWAVLEAGDAKVKAKLDSGAKTGSIHAEDIEAFERDGEDWVRFRVPLATRKHASTHDHDLRLERPVVRTVLIKQHKRKSLRRYVVEMDFCVGGLRFTTPMTLADRSRFLYPVLLGRTALENRALIDPARKYRADETCPQ